MMFTLEKLPCPPNAMPSGFVSREMNSTRGHKYKNKRVHKTLSYKMEFKSIMLLTFGIFRAAVYAIFFLASADYPLNYGG